MEINFRVVICSNMAYLRDLQNCQNCVKSRINYDADDEKNDCRSLIVRSIMSISVKNKEMYYCTDSANGSVTAICKN